MRRIGEPERMLDQFAVIVESASPVGDLAPGHTADEGWAVLARHRRGFVFMARLDLDAANE